jgi:hypothetical protein
MAPALHRCITPVPGVIELLLSHGANPLVTGSIKDWTLIEIYARTSNLEVFFHILPQCIVFLLYGKRHPE